MVYGDIGTSPLYTMKEVFNPVNGIPLDAFHLIGAVSVIFWGLMMVVTLKYVQLILRADNRGEGMAQWREAMFAVMSRNAGSMADFFRLPNNCVIELGKLVQI